MTEEFENQEKTQAELNEAQKAELKKVMQRDAKSGRKLTGFWGYLISAMSVVMVLFYLYAAGIEPMAVQYHRGIYVLLTFVMTFLLFPLWSRSRMERPTVVDIALALVAAAVVLYWIVEFEALNYRSGAETSLDVAVSIVGILISLEVCRRVLGPSLTIVGIVFLVYGYFGPYFPSPFDHRGFDIDRIATGLYLEQSGVFGIMANVLVTYVILFIFFGAFLQKSGVGRFFIDWPLALAGRTLGGPAKVSVIASTFFGSVSGSAIANTVSTGSFTIPLMRRAGFKPHVAGAIEPAASIGGMFMPPIMGAGGFIMAELTSVPYIEIMKMALFPALLYFFSVFSMIHFEAKKHNIRGSGEASDAKAWPIFKKHWLKATPLLIIVVMMLLGYSPGMSAFWATLSCVAISWLDPEYRMGPKQIYEAMVTGAKSTLVIGATLGVIGIIVGTIAMTGIGLKFADIIISLSAGNLPIAIGLIGIASLVLGMGVPVTAAYLITAVLTVDALTGPEMMGSIHGAGTVSALIGAHMIVYWFSQDSNITPPVCVAAYAGAAIAGSDPWKTGWTSFKFAKLLYVVPFLFAYEPAFLLAGTWADVAHAWGSAILGTLAFSALTMGYFMRRTNIPQWLILAAATFLCYHTSYYSNFAGIGLVVLIYLWQRWQNKRDEASAVPA